MKKVLRTMEQNKRSYKNKINNSDDFDKKYMKINFSIQMMI